MSNVTFDRYIGMQHDEVCGWIDIEPHHCNPTGAINGAVFLSMADNHATGVANDAFFEKYGERKFLVGVDLHATMLANQQGGRVRVTGEALRVGRRITVVRSEVLGDGDRLLCAVTSTHVPT